jgi:glucosaminylphosphatidylinositol acyltransferase
VHWNFFITLGLLPPFVTLLRLMKGKHIPFSIFAAIIIGSYQWALYHVPFRGESTILNFIISAPRTDLISQNREGVFSFFGIFSYNAANGRVSIDIPSGIRYWKSHFAGCTAFTIIHKVSA